MDACLTAFTCTCCRSSRGDLFLADCRDYYLGKPGRWDYYRCQDCGVVQLAPIPENLAAFYEAYQVHTAKSRLHQLLRKLIMSRGYYFPKEVGGGRTLLDFGCGDGWYLQEMAKRGWTVRGFESDPGYALELSRRCGFPVSSDLTEMTRSCSNFFDGVTMHFVLEHLDDTPARFEMVRGLLKPGGHFYFMVPNIESFECKLFGRKWHGLDPPRHVVFVNDKLVERLARQNQLAVVATKKIGLPNMPAGSVTAALLGRYSYHLFAAMIPISLIFCLLFPSNTLCYLLKKG